MTTQDKCCWPECSKDPYLIYINRPLCHEHWLKLRVFGDNFTPLQQALERIRLMALNNEEVCRVPPTYKLHFQDPFGKKHDNTR